MIASSVPSLAALRLAGEVSTFDDMPWAEPQNSRERINLAGNRLVAGFDADSSRWSSEEWAAWEHSLVIVNNWRASHGYPLNTFQMNLRGSARRCDAAALVAQRTKRLSSIADKLRRFPSMKLSQMQDIGGCRAVLKSVAEVRELFEYYEKKSGIKHERASVDDYVAEPKESGYRGVHLVYRYVSDKKPKAIYNGLKIEMQLRSQYQHAWATAVETVGTFVRQALKSSIGHDEWLRFFALMGSAIAMREKQPLVPDTPTNRKELVDELEERARELDVANRLRGYGNAMRTIRQQSAEEAKAHYYLLQLDPGQNELTVTGFRADELEAASSAYLDAERHIGDRAGSDAVLVSVESLASLERAYPNYFADTRVFVQLLVQALSGHRRRISMPPLTPRPS